MADEKQAEPVEQLCSIRILFPVKTDENAVAYKKKIAEVLAAIPKAQIHFSIMTPPDRNPYGSQVF